MALTSLAMVGCGVFTGPTVMTDAQYLKLYPDPPQEANSVYTELCKTAGVRIYKKPENPMLSIAFLKPRGEYSNGSGEYFRRITNIDEDDPLFDFQEYPRDVETKHLYPDWIKTYKLNQAEIERSDGTFARWTKHNDGSYHFEGNFKDRSSQFNMTWGRSPNFDSAYRRKYLINDGYISISDNNGVLLGTATLFAVVLPPFDKWMSRHICGGAGTPTGPRYVASIPGLIYQLDGFYSGHSQ